MPADATQVAADWASRLAASGDKIQRGVQAVQTSPGQLAARQADVWANNAMAAKSKFARNAARVSLGDWQQAMITKGVPRIATGAQAGQAKMAAFLQSFLPFVEGVRRSLPPRGTLDQNIQRMVANARAISQYGTRSGQ